MIQLWAPPAKVFRACGYDELQALYRDIRLNQFPFAFVKRGKRILISLRSVGLVTDSAKEEKQDQAVVSEATA